MKTITTRKTGYSLHIEDEDDTIHKIHNFLTVKQIVAMRDVFGKQIGRHMPRNVFRKALSDIGGIYMSDNDFETLCKKFNFSKLLHDISWEDFLVHLRVGLDSEIRKSCANQLEKPISCRPREFRSYHRIPISKMIFIPEITEARQVNHLYGVYVTCSREGTINYWSMDMELERTVYSKSPKLKNQQTWITDIVALPDVSVICTCSTERDLRFYDITARKFELRVYITSLEEMITAMHYTFYEDVTQESKLVLGNSCGRVMIIFVDSKDRGAFKSRPKIPLRTVTWAHFLKGAINGLRLEEIPTEHTDWVRQVSYYQNINCVVSISACSKESMLVYNAKSNNQSGYSFKVPKGFTCFTIAVDAHMVITGGPDFLIRVWNPFITDRALTVLRGHHAFIVSVVIQDDNRVLISLDKDKCIKIWDVAEQICLQSYYGLPASLGERTLLCTYYNPCSRQFFVASNRIVWIQVYPLLNGEYTDGISHSKEVSVILYNTLFKSVITCGFDSFIIVWNPWKGKTIQFIRDAHTVHRYGITVPVEITAAAFDPTQQFLITGASDGTLKIWNFIVKTCIRNMSIEKDNEIYAITWIKYRILVMGENRVVTEFADVHDIGSSQFKSWMKRHEDDIMCAATNLPTTLVTASYSGELVFWRMETGQPYGIYNVSNPTERIKMKYQKQTKKSSAQKYSQSTQRNYNTINRTIVVPYKFSVKSRLAIFAVLCLTARPILPDTGNLVVAIDDGTIQIWSSHSAGGFLTEYCAVHGTGDYVVSLATDANNEYLFTGHMQGYVKTWHMVNFAVPEENKVHVSMPPVRLKFPFLWKQTFLGRAIRGHRANHYWPLLLNCIKCHLKPVTGLIFIDTVEIYISSSSDGSARIWSLAGRYMGTLGTFKPWTQISPYHPPTDRLYNLPADIQRSASSTTLRVMSGGTFERQLTKKKQQQQFDQMNEDSLIYGKRVDLDNILGQHFKLPKRGFNHYNITLDKSLQDVPIYSELIMPQPEKVKCPETPSLVRAIIAQHRVTKAKLFVPESARTAM